MFTFHLENLGASCCHSLRVDATNWGETQKIIEAIHNLSLDGVDSRRDADEVCAFTWESCSDHQRRFTLLVSYFRDSSECLVFLPNDTGKSAFWCSRVLPGIKAKRPATCDISCSPLSVFSLVHSF